MDGSLGSHTAAMKAPYSDDPNLSAYLSTRQGDLNKMAVERAAAGFQLGFHAIGDKATSMAADAFSTRRFKTGAQSYRARPGRRSADIPRFKQLGVATPACNQTTCLPMSTGLWIALAPSAPRTHMHGRHSSTLACRSPSAQTIPSSRSHPFAGLFEAVTRTDKHATKTLSPENKLTRGQAAAHTQGSRLPGAEKHVRLAPGFVALPSLIATSTSRARQPSSTRRSCKPG